MAAMQHSRLLTEIEDPALEHPPVRRQMLYDPAWDQGLRASSGE